MRPPLRWPQSAAILPCLPVLSSTMGKEEMGVGLKTEETGRRSIVYAAKERFLLQAISQHTAKVWNWTQDRIALSLAELRTTLSGRFERGVRRVQRLLEDCSSESEGIFRILRADRTLIRRVPDTPSDSRVLQVAFCSIFCAA